jgi:hypothetical protein
LFWLRGNLQYRSNACAENAVQYRGHDLNYPKIGNRSKLFLVSEIATIIHRVSLVSSLNQLQSGVAQLQNLRRAGRLTSGSSSFAALSGTACRSPLT